MSQLATRTADDSLAPTSAQSISLMPVEQMQPLLAEYKVRRKSFRDWVLSQLQRGLHYGIPPGINNPETDPTRWQHDKPSLYKAGAELLCDLLMLSPNFEPDPETWKMLGGINGMVVLKCTLVSAADSPFFPTWKKGEKVGEGRGSAKVGDKKRDGNGAIKIAEKSSKIDAIINTLGISDLFGQDRDGPEKREAPDGDGSAPYVQPRDQRTEDGPPKVTKEMLGELCFEWGRKNNREIKDNSEFAAWAKRLLHAENDMTLVRHWTIDAVDVCAEALR